MGKIVVTSQPRSISDDDLCADCRSCIRQADGLSRSQLNWPGQMDEDGYVASCPQMEVPNAGQSF